MGNAEFKYNLYNNKGKYNYTTNYTISILVRMKCLPPVENL